MPVDRRRFRASLCGLLPLLALGGFGCGGGEALVEVPRVVTVTVGGPASTLQAGGTLQLSLNVRASDGATVAYRELTWSSSDTAVARVSSTGLVSGRLPGPVTITAATDVGSGTLALSVTVPALALRTNGLTGHIGVSMNEASVRATHGAGFSYYTTIYPLQPTNTASTQLGWGVWVQPENYAFTQPLCPVGTVARDNWPERGPTYRDVYQTLEGGAGMWTSQRFPSAMSKFRINSTPDCYNYQVASTGWHFYGTVLPADKLGLAQLSNRLLTVPDGVVFAPGQPALLGYGWLALPLIPATTSALGVPTGDQSWTLFLNAQNFRGPVAFFTPEVWSAVHAVDRTGVGRGLDARSAISPGVSLEIGQTPAFEAEVGGVRYRRVPRINFAAQGGRAALMQDVRYYSRAAIWNSVSQWAVGSPFPSQIQSSGVTTVPMGALSSTLRLAETTVAFEPSTFFSTAFTNAGGGQTMGIQWSGGLEPGVLPEYYQFDGTAWRPIAATQIPRETFLAEQTFPAMSRRTFPDPVVSGGPWDASRWRAGPFTVTLQDGSVVDYVWYRFADQPAIARLGLDANALARLQAIAEAMHERTALNGIALADPTSGPLVTVDPAQLVTPPPGLERGFVPIVIRQR